MYTTNMQQFKTQQLELHRQANQFRLTKSLLESNRNGTRRLTILGRFLAQPLQSSNHRNSSAG